MTGYSLWENDMKLKSDTWDSGNSMTRFYEVIRECETCHGEGTILNPEIAGEEPCPDCDGQGKVTYYD